MAAQGGFAQPAVERPDTTEAAAGNPAPPLRVGRVTIVSRDIFSAEEVQQGSGPLRLLRRTMNGLHVNTRDHVLRRELLFAGGDPYRPDELAETERNLRALGFLSEVAVTAVDTATDGTVAVAVAARESWSLQTNFAYTRASDGDQRWNVQLSEQNFLGYGVTVGLGVGADENSGYWNLWYRQRRLLGRPLWFGFDDSDRQDGHVRNVFLHRPFYAQDDPWGMELTAWDRLYDTRYYLSNAGPAGADPARPRSLYALLPYTDGGVEGRLAWRLGGKAAGAIWRLGAGARVTWTRYDLGAAAYELSDGRYVALDWLGAPGDPLARERGTTVQPYLWLQSVGRNWTESRFVLQYGVDEDVPLDTALDLKIGPELAGLGTTTGEGRDRVRAEGWIQRWLRAGGGLLLLRLEGEAERGPQQPGHHQLDAVAGWVRAGAGPTPWLSRAFVEGGLGANLEGSQAFVLGLDQGLRTLQFDGMAGDRLLRWTLEQGKAMPGEALGLFRWGLAAFYSGGSAWYDGEDRGLGDGRHELGVGLRFGPTRSANTQIGRIDLAWDLQGGGSPALTATTKGLF